MHLTFRNVNSAFNGMIKGIQNKLIPTTAKPSRAGDVLKINEPVLLTFEKPLERVLFNVARDANPFFMLYESMWMLAGRNDVAPLQYYSSKIGDVASDDGATFNGAYGWRWRKHPGKPEPKNGAYLTKAIDQLPILIRHLKAKPESRRAVLQMWRVVDDLLKIDPHGDIPATKDVCCNTAAYFSLRLGMNEDTRSNYYRYLDMTVTNRSNDLIWGLLGANICHFSFLQEYMANALGVEVGHYHQFANDLHVYTANNGGFKPDEWLKDGTDDLYTISPATNIAHVPLVRDVVMFDREVQEFVGGNYVDQNDKEQTPELQKVEWAEPFLQLVAQPMCDAFHYHKRRDYVKALEACNHIHATDWRIAATQWIQKRRQNYESKPKMEKLAEQYGKEVSE